ncbi:MAG: GCN5-related N-acetyltransferase [Marmoricola sp.]|jgi:ribosomal protein S18 acetylase RimI-like enzyme|nr:GCN5-related N-acetyltransferase [Marmoricola sp.]
MRIELVDPDTADPKLLDEIGVQTATVYLAGDFIAPADGYVERLRDATRRAREAELWIALGDNGVLLGSVTFCPTGSSYVEIAEPGEGEFRMLAVSPLARRLGIGSNLVDKCIERSRELGHTGVRLSTMSTMTAAHKIYQRLGFVRDEAHDWSPVPGVLLWAFYLALAGPVDSADVAGR